MKFSTLIIIALLGVIAYALLNPRRPALENGQTPPTSDNAKPSPLSVGAELLTALGRSSESKERAKTGPSVRVDATAPVPEVHATKAATVRGLVVGVEDQFAVVDCTYKVELSAEELAHLSRMGNANANLAVAMQQQAEMKVFGVLKMVNERGQLGGVDIKTRQSADGKVLLTGLSLRAGDFIHVVTAPIGQHPSGLPVYAARMKLMGGAWMWNRNAGTLDPPPR